MLERTVEFAGCFNDNNGERDLDGKQLEVRASGQGAVLECATACQGYTYMGLQWSDECFCGNTYGSQGEAALSECDSDGDVSEGIADMCGVDGQETCGNHNAVCEYAFSCATQEIKWLDGRGYPSTSAAGLLILRHRQEHGPPERIHRLLQRQQRRA